MNKAKLIETIVAKTGLSKSAVASVLDTMLDVITQTIKQGDIVSLTGFGKFSSRLRSARMGVDPLNPTQKIQMPAVLVPKFKSGKALKDALKQK